MQSETQSTELGGIPATRQSLHYSLLHFRFYGKKEANDEANFALICLVEKTAKVASASEASLASAESHSIWFSTCVPKQDC